MKIDISKIVQEPQSFDEELCVDADRLGADLVAGPISVRLTGEVRPHGDVFSIGGRCAAEGPLTCSRCLEPVPWDVAEDYSFEYRMPAAAPLEAESGLDEDELDVAFLQGEELDLVELAAEQVLLAMPMRILCEDDCAGLCPRCGANLNQTDDCGCKPEVDPRWGPLADLAGSARES